MKLNVILQDQTFAGIVDKIKKYFDAEIKTFRIEMSLFEQYEVRPRKKHIPKIWEYRIVAQHGYKFGRLENENSNSNS
jgi:hypothetical protein